MKRVGVRRGTLEELTLALLIAGLGCDRGGDATRAPEAEAGAGSAETAPAAPQASAPEDAAPPVEEDGDRDGDGIRDRDDRCPEVCETINGVDDDDGCPDTPPPPADELAALAGVVEGIYFDINKATIKPKSYAVLDNLAEILIRHPEPAVELRVHRDEFPGVEYYGSEITQRRARSLVAYLVARGVPNERLQGVGYGAEMPIDTNKTPEGRARNRRVELVLLERRATFAEGCTSPTAPER